MSGQSAIAWSLEAPSATGGKEYKVLLFGKYVLVGWGSRGGTVQYKVYVEYSSAAAHDFALDLTQQKEKKGYVLVREPVASHAPADQWADYLPRWKNHRGASTDLDRVFKMMFIEGQELTV